MSCPLDWSMRVRTTPVQWYPLTAAGACVYATVKVYVEVDALFKYAACLDGKALCDNFWHTPFCDLKTRTLSRLSTTAMSSLSKSHKNCGASAGVSKGNMLIRCRRRLGKPYPWPNGTDRHTGRSRGLSLRAEADLLRLVFRNALLRAYCDSLEDEAEAEAERLRLELVSQQQRMFDDASLKTERKD